MRFQLAQLNAIRGDQLATEIEIVTGMRLDRHAIVFYPPQEVEIAGVDESHQAAIAAVVAAHVPNAEYSAQDRLRKRIRDAAQSAAGIKIDDLTAVQQRALIVVLLFRAGALDGEGRVRALAEWA